MAGVPDDAYRSLIEVFKTETGGCKLIKHRLLMNVIQGLDPAFSDETLLTVMKAAGALKEDGADYEALLDWLFRVTEKKPTSLVQHYLSSRYADGFPMMVEGTGYVIQEANQLYFHRDSGFQVMLDAIDLLPDMAPGKARVLFLYTGEPTFCFIRSEAGQLSENTLSLIQHTNGKGVYLSGIDPVELWHANNDTDRQDQTHTKHCIPFIVPEDIVVPADRSAEGLPDLPDLWLLSVEKPRDLELAALASTVRRKRVIVKRYEATFGLADTRTLAAMNEFCFLLESQDSVQEAVSLSRRLLKVSEDQFGANSEAVLTNLANLAYLLEREGSMAEAEELARKALEGREAVLGKDHQDTNVSVNNLAHLLEAVKKLDEAKQLFLRDMEWCKVTYGARSAQARESDRNYTRFCAEHEIGAEHEKKRIRRKRYATGPQLGGF